uniref:Uncharacterized protein n=1 Tax=Bombyx mori TaxID=7091 RepID=A0A8R2QVK7_BOMMO|nr:uncharacterized protein LOC119628995 [Bombyx mori]
MRSATPPYPSDLSSRIQEYLGILKLKPGRSQVSCKEIKKDFGFETLICDIGGDIGVDRTSEYDLPTGGCNFRASAYDRQLLAIDSLMDFCLKNSGHLRLVAKCDPEQRQHMTFSSSILQLSPEWPLPHLKQRGEDLHCDLM